jgi:hypothetical protein
MAAGNHDGETTGEEALKDIEPSGDPGTAWLWRTQEDRSG